MLSSVTSLPATAEDEELDLDTEMRAERNLRNLPKNFEQYPSNFKTEKRKISADFSTDPASFDVLRIVQG